MLLMMCAVSVPANACACSTKKICEINFQERVGPVTVEASDLIDYLDPCAISQLPQELQEMLICVMANLESSVLELLSQLPEDVQQKIGSVDILYLDGMIHLHITVWEKKGAYFVNL